MFLGIFLSYLIFYGCVIAALGYGIRWIVRGALEPIEDRLDRLQRQLNNIARAQREPD